MRLTKMTSRIAYLDNKLAMSCLVGSNDPSARFDEVGKESSEGMVMYTNATVYISNSVSRSLLIKQAIKLRRKRRYLLYEGVHPHHCIHPFPAQSFIIPIFFTIRRSLSVLLIGIHGYHHNGESVMSSAISIKKPKLRYRMNDDSRRMGEDGSTTIE